MAEKVNGLNVDIKKETIKKETIKKEDMTMVSQKQISADFVEPEVVSINCKVNTVSDIPIGNTEHLSTALASKKVGADDDLMYLKLRYVHEGANENFDEFIGAELSERYTSAIYKPLDWSHDSKQIIGTIYDSELVPANETENGRLGVDIYTVIYKRLFPAYAEEIAKRFAKGTLYVSMETWFEEAECSECHGKFSHSSLYCSHLRQRYSTANSYTRILHGITFGGAGIVEVPGDKDAKALTLASDLKKRTEKEMEIKRFETMMYQATNLYYNIIYNYYKNDDEKKKAKIDLDELFSDIKMYLDSINTKQIVKGSKMEYTQEVVDALVKMAKADSSEAFTSKLAEETKKLSTDYDAKFTEASAKIKEQDEVIAKQTKELEEITNKYNDMVNAIAKEKLIAERLKVLAENNIDTASFSDENTKAEDVLAEMDEKTFNLLVKAAKKTEKQMTPEEQKAYDKKKKEDEEKEKQKGVANDKTEANLTINDEDNFTDASKEEDLVLKAISNL